MTDLGAPPSDGLDGFPTRTLGAGTRLFRIHHAPLGPCWFSSFEADDPRGGRFDLPPPAGASYWSLRPEAAFLETIARRPVALIPLEVLDRYRQSDVALPVPLTAANSPVKRARAFGLTAEFHTTSDYRVTRRWASALFRAGHRALIGVPRHDVTVRLRTVTLFGQAGEHVPPRWKRAITTQPISAELVDAMAEWGIRCLPIPFDVDTV